MTEIKPRRMRLEAASACQLKCPSCPTASGKIKKTIGTGFLKFRDFQKIVMENPGVRHIELSNWGEMFLNPELMEIMKYGHERGIILTAENGVNLNNVSDEVLEALVKYKFRSMTCSIDGASQDTYGKYRVRGHFDKVMEHLEKINKFKTLHNSKYPLLTWQYIVFGHNENEIAEARGLAKELGMGFLVKLSWDSSFSPIKNPDSVRKQIGHGAVSREEFRHKKRKSYRQKFICSQLWTKPQVNWDGRILGCCVNTWGDFGNAFESGLMRSLNSERMNYAREMLLGRKPEGADIPCTTCHFYKEMKEDGSFLTMKDIRTLDWLEWFKNKFSMRLKYYPLLMRWL